MESIPSTDLKTQVTRQRQWVTGDTTIAIRTYDALTYAESERFHNGMDWTCIHATNCPTIEPSTDDTVWISKPQNPSDQVMPFSMRVHTKLTDLADIPLVRSHAKF